MTVSGMAGFLMKNVLMLVINTVRLMNDLKAQGLQINEEKIEDCNKAAQNYIRYISGKIYNRV